METRSSTVRAEDSDFPVANMNDMEVDAKPISKPIDFGVVTTGARQLAEQRRKAREERRKLEAEQNPQLAR